MEPLLGVPRAIAFDAARRERRRRPELASFRRSRPESAGVRLSRPESAGVGRTRPEWFPVSGLSR